MSLCNTDCRWRSIWSRGYRSSAYSLTTWGGIAILAGSACISLGGTVVERTGAPDRHPDSRRGSSPAAGPATEAKRGAARARVGIESAARAHSGTESAARVADVLTLFIAGPAALGVSEISRELGLSKAVVHRILQSLASRAF